MDLTAEQRPAEDAARSSPDARKRHPRCPPQMELVCLMCGDRAGTLDVGGVVRCQAPGTIRLKDNQLRCGRCGGNLVRGWFDSRLRVR